MGRKIIGIIIILSGFFVMGILVYFVLLGNDWQDIFKYFGISSQNEEIISITSEKERENGDSDDINSIDQNQNTPRRINISEETENPGNQDEIIQQSQIKPLDRAFGKEDIMRMAASFAERFGSYSNQSDFSNILDLKIFMTRNMQIWADSYVFENRSIPQSADIYYGITTRSVEEELLDFDDEIGQAKVLVSTRRQEARSDRANVSDVFVQNIEVSLKKENGAWKVDQAFWKAR